MGSDCFLTETIARQGMVTPGTGQMQNVLPGTRTPGLREDIQETGREELAAAGLWVTLLSPPAKGEQ